METSEISTSSSLLGTCHARAAAPSVGCSVKGEDTQSAGWKPKAEGMFQIIYFSEKAEAGESCPTLLGPTWEAGTHNAPIRFRRERTPGALQRPKDNC